MSEDDRPAVAVFRPDDDRLADAIDILEGLDVQPIPDPMLAIETTGFAPRTDADYAILTSKTGVEIAAEHEWTADGTTVCAIGDATAGVLDDAGYEVDVIPEEFSSRGMVDRLGPEVDGARVEVARSDHGSATLLDGLEAAGAYVHETVLYRLVRPKRTGGTADRAAAGDLDAALFTSSLTVENFLEAAEARGVREAALAGLDEAVVGAIGMPTKETAEHRGIDVDVVPSDADFEQLARAVVSLL